MDKEDLQSLIERLRTERLDWKERRDLSRRIVEAPPELRAEMGRVVREERDPAFKVELLNLVGATQDPAYENEVLKILRSDEPQEVLQTAATTLGKLKSPGAFDVLIDLLDHSHANVRLGAIYGLIALGDKRAVAFLLKCLDDHASVHCWWPSPKDGGYVIDREASLAIDAITGESFRGDRVKIRDWLRALR